jgi:hypothetical protein
MNAIWIYFGVALAAAALLYIRSHGSSMRKDLAKFVVVTLICVVALAVIQAQQPNLDGVLIIDTEASLAALENQEILHALIVFACMLASCALLSLRIWLGTLSAVLAGVLFFVFIANDRFDEAFEYLPDFLVRYLSSGAVLLLAYVGAKQAIKLIRRT